MKIAILANKDRQDQVFKPEHIERMGIAGDVILCEENDGPSEETASRIIKDADIAVTSWNCPSLSEKILSEAPDLKLLIHAAGSVKSIVTDYLWEKGVRVSSAAAALGRGVAETALGLTIISLKNIMNLSRLTSMGGWNSRNDTVRELYDVRIGVIGAGYAGRHFIKLLKDFDTEILLYDPTLSDKECKELGTIKSELNELMSSCDVISIHAPSIPSTRHMINEGNLSMMKDRAVLINTARGTVIDEKALVKELKNGRISACIDVTDPEPPSELNELRIMPNVILTPHIAGAVTNGKKRIGDLVVSEISSYMNNGELEYEVFRNKLKTMG